MNNWKSNGFLMFKQLCICFVLIFLAPVTQAAFDGSAPVVLKSEPSNVILEQVSISDGNGGTWIAWIDGNGANDDELIISKINSFGTINRAATFLVSSPQTLSSLVLAVDETDAQSLYLAWTDNNNGGVVGQPSLFVARFNENFGSGALQWNQEITPTSGSAKENPDLVIANGDPIVAWSDFRTGNPNIRATRLSALSGVTVWSDRAVFSRTANQNNVSLAVGSGDINLFVGYTEEEVNENIRLVKLDVDLGTPLMFTEIKNFLGDVIVLSPALISDNNGGFFVSWHQGFQSQPVSIYLRRLNSSLTNVGASSVKIADTGKDRNSVNYQMTSDKNGGVVLTWIDGRNASDDVYASRINSLLQPLWGSSGVRVTDSGINLSVNSPSIVSDSVGGAFVSYSRENNDSSVRQVRLNYIASNTLTDPIGGFPSTTASGSAVLQLGTINLVETTNGVVASYVGTESSLFFPDKVFAQVFAGAIFPSRIETPIAVSPVANASLAFNTAFTLSASDFIMAGGGNHSSSNIEIRDSGDNIVISEPFNGSSTDFNISQTLASNLLSGQSYSWRVRYTAITGETSALSEPRTFLVAAATTPTITGLVNQSLDLTLGGNNVSQSFTLSDPVGDVNDVVVTATSSNQSSIADSAISISGSGNVRNITVNPTTGGTVTIT